MTAAPFVFSALVFSGTGGADYSHIESSAFPLTAPMPAVLRHVYQLTPGPGEAATKMPSLVPVPGLSKGSIPSGDKIVDGTAYRAVWGMKKWGPPLRQAAWVTNADKMLEALISADLLSPKGSKLPVRKGKEDDAAEYAARLLLDFKEFPGRSELQSQVESWVAAQNKSGATPSGKAIRASILLSQIQAGSGLSRQDEVIDQFVARPWQPGSLGAEELLDTLETLLAIRGLGVEKVPLPLLEKFRGAILKRLNDGVLKPEVLRPSLEGRYVTSILRLGAMSTNPNTFIQGVRTLRQTLALVETPFNQSNGLEYGDLSTGRMGSSPTYLATKESGSYFGFFRAEGQLMASVYEINERFGGLYTSLHGWTVAIDGLSPDPSGARAIFGMNPDPYMGFFQPVHVTEGKGRVTLKDLPFQPGIRRVRPAWVDGQVVVVAEPSFRVVPSQRVPLEGRFGLPNGGMIPAKLGPLGFQAVLPKGAAEAGPITFVGSAGDDSLGSVAWVDLQPAPFPRWETTRGLKVAGVKPQKGIWKTGAAVKGRIISPPFLITEPMMAFKSRLGADCSVVLAEDETGRVLLSESRPGKAARNSVWNLIPFKGKLARLIVADESRTDGLEFGEIWMVRAGKGK